MFNVELNIIADVKHSHNLSKWKEKDVQGERTNWIFMMRFESLEWIEVDLMRKIDTLFNLVHVFLCLYSDSVTIYVFESIILGL